MSKVIELSDVSVTYKIRHGAGNTLKDTFIQTFKRQSHDVDVKALTNVSMSLEPGEVLAVVGRNGAGKSTLLKVLARVLPPTTGRAIVRGTVAPMIELGAGFNGELTGRENTLMYGSLLGRKVSEMRERVDEIANWAGLQDFIDLPLRTYSSGMVARLAFGIATDRESDLILIDEVLAVGDADFQKRSQARMDELLKGNSAVVLVTHSDATARKMASKGLWIDRGNVMKYGEINDVIDAYLQA